MDVIRIARGQEPKEAELAIAVQPTSNEILEYAMKTKMGPKPKEDISIAAPVIDEYPDREEMDHIEWLRGL